MSAAADCANIAICVNRIIDDGGGLWRGGVIVSWFLCQLIQDVIFVFRQCAVGIRVVDGVDLLDFRDIPIGVILVTVASEDHAVSVSDCIGSQPGCSAGAVATIIQV